MKTQTPLEKLRLFYHPKLPKALHQMERLIPIQKNGSVEPQGIDSNLNSLFPSLFKQSPLHFELANGGQASFPAIRVGVVLSGGQAAGGHNVITGLYDAMIRLNPKSALLGFKEGPSGIIEKKYVELPEEVLAEYRNQGGFDLIGSGRTKIETPEQFQAAKNTAVDLNLDAIVIIGGDDSNTNAALLAEYFLKNSIKTRVIGVPKTIDGDLKNESIEISFGFDTACKIYSEYIGNVLRDSLSQGKYYFFIKLMGRSASHITLECALQTHPNLALIGEEVEANKQTIRDITAKIADLITERASHGKEYGVVLIPEGLIEFIPECKTMIAELNALLSSDKPHSDKLEGMSQRQEKVDYVTGLLSESSAACLRSMPAEIQAQLLMDRDPHGNVQVSKIETERLFIETVKVELARRKKAGTYNGKFNAQPLFCGYEGRSCFPTNFDAQYCYALGHVAALLINHGATGYMSAVHNLALPIDEWQISGVPLVNMMTMEMRKGKLKPVIRKALVDLNGLPFKAFAEKRKLWELADDYCYPGPIQYFGPTEITDVISATLAYESKKNTGF